MNQFAPGLRLSFIANISPVDFDLAKAKSTKQVILSKILQVKPGRRPGASWFTKDYQTFGRQPSIVRNLLSFFSFFLGSQFLRIFYHLRS